MNFFNKESEHNPSEEKQTLIDKIQNIDSETASNIRLGLNVGFGIATLGSMHAVYYVCMFINWFVDACTGIRAVDNLEWDPFANIKMLNPDMEVEASNFSF